MAESVPGAARGATLQPPGFLQGALRIFDLSLAQMLWSRRTIFMALVVGLPVFISIVLRLLVEFGVPVMRVRNAPITGDLVFGLMIWGLFVRFAIPVLAIFYGTSLIADEVEDKTITYLFTRPIPRGAVLVGKYFAYLVSTISVVLPAVMLVWLLIAPINGSLAQSFPSLVKDLAILALGLAVYGAVFALAGATLKRPLVSGLLFVFGFESLVLAMPGYLRQVTVAYYLQGLVPHAMPSDSPIEMMQVMFRVTPSLTESLIGLAAIGVLTLWLAARVVSRREYVLEQ